MTERKFMLLPPLPEACQVCGRNPAHRPDEPHNRDSLYYQTKFQMEHGYPPTWLDAMAHCSLETQVKWERELRKAGVWDG